MGGTALRQIPLAEILDGEELAHCLAEQLGDGEMDGVVVLTWASSIATWTSEADKSCWIRWNVSRRLNSASGNFLSEFTRETCVCAAERPS